MRADACVLERLSAGGAFLAPAAGRPVYPAGISDGGVPGRTEEVEMRAGSVCPGVPTLAVAARVSSVPGRRPKGGPPSRGLHRVPGGVGAAR